jgi:hypothetical protein
MIPFLVGSWSWSVGLVKEIFVLPWLLYWDQYKNFFLTVHYLNSFVPIAQQAGQAAVLGRLSLSVCLWLSHIQRYTLFPTTSMPSTFIS